MQITVNETEYCKLQVQYETDAEAVSSKKTELINKFKSKKVPGFRPGKATSEAIRLHYRKEIDQTLAQELAQDAVHNVIFENNIKLFGQPTFSYLNLEENRFRCEFSLFKQPDFELASYKEFEIPKPSVGLSVEELSQKMVQDLRTKYGQTIPYGENDFVQMGDTIILDYKSSIDGEVIEKLTSSGEILNVGRINIPGFSENLLGMTANESRSFDLLMPDTYKPEYAGKTLKFEVKILMGSKVEPAPLNDELAKNLGVESFDKLMENVKSTSTTRIRELEKNSISDQIAKRLIENHEFRIPEWISSAEARVNARNSGHEWDSIPDSDKELHIANAEKSIKLSLILQNVRDNEPDAQLTDEEVFSNARTNIAKFSAEPEKVMAEIFQNGHLPILFNRIRDEYTLEFIEKTCKFIE
jgi:trigger factor